MGRCCVESLLVGHTHRLMAHCQPLDTCPLHPCQQAPSCHVQIGQPAANLEPVDILASPRYRMLVQPKIRVITKPACSTFASTVDFVRFQSRAASLSG